MTWDFMGGVYTGACLAVMTEYFLAGVLTYVLARRMMGSPRVVAFLLAVGWPVVGINTVRMMLRHGDVLKRRYEA